MRDRGFTLIELLVVIAIIAILAAILFPVFMSAQETARQAACVSNGGQVGKALTLYTDDHGGRFPLCWFKGLQGQDLTWAHSLLPYARSLRCFNCPSVPKRQFTGVTAPDSSGDGDRITGGFGYNVSYGGTGLQNGIGRGSSGEFIHPVSYRQSDLASATQHIAFGDSSLNTELKPPLYPTYKFCDCINSFPQGVLYVPPDFRHKGGATFIFCDGHAKWYTKDYFSDWQHHSHHWYMDNQNR